MVSGDGLVVGCPWSVVRGWWSVVRGRWLVVAKQKSPAAERARRRTLVATLGSCRYSLAAANELGRIPVILDQGPRLWTLVVGLLFQAFQRAADVLDHAVLDG
jgi:hypothetical protein